MGRYDNMMVVITGRDRQGGRLSRVRSHVHDWALTSRGRPNDPALNLKSCNETSPRTNEERSE